MADSSVHQQFGKTRAEWLANLNTEYKPARNFRRTSIICTIGMFGRAVSQLKHDMDKAFGTTTHTMAHYRPQDQLG